MNILKIVYFIVWLFGWKPECKVLLLPSPKVFNLERIHFLTKTSLSEKDSSEIQDVSNGMEDPMAIVPAECQIDIPASNLLALAGLIILVGLCLTCLLKMRRQLKAKSIGTSIRREDVEDRFFDLELDECEKFFDLEFDEYEKFFDLKEDWSFDLGTNEKDRLLDVETDEGEEFLDLENDEDGDSWHSSVEPQWVLYCKVLSDEECSKQTEV